ncbi:MAG: luciferase family protein [Rhizobiaceae bacterium]
MSNHNFALPKRVGQKPRTTTTNPHQQYDQFATPEALQAALDAVKNLPGLRLGPSQRAPYGTVGLYLDEGKGPEEAFMLGREFAHFHPIPDGSLHLTLPQGIREEAIATGWAEPHPLAGYPTVSKQIVLIYAPRTVDEAEITAKLVAASYDYANGNTS